jgi:hypothetical protein
MSVVSVLNATQIFFFFLQQQTQLDAVKLNIHGVQEVADIVHQI